MPDPATDDSAQVLARVELTVEDHTRIIQSILDNLFAVIRELDVREYVDDGTPLAGETVLEAALTVPAVDDYTKARIRDVLRVQSALGQLESAERVSDTMRERTDELARLVEAEDSIPAKIERLEAARERGDLHRETTETDFLSAETENEFVSRTTDLLVDLLQDGQKSIYWPNASYYQRLAATDDDPIGAVQRSLVGDIANGDSKGLIGGAAGGCAAGSLAGGVGCAPGAVTGGLAGGVAGSASEAVGAALDAIFD